MFRSHRLGAPAEGERIEAFRLAPEGRIETSGARGLGGFSEVSDFQREPRGSESPLADAGCLHGQPLPTHRRFAEVSGQERFAQRFFRRRSAGRDDRGRGGRRGIRRLNSDPRRGGFFRWFVLARTAYASAREEGAKEE